MRHWTAASVGLTASIAVAGALIGFIVLPAQTGAGADGSVWTEICAAAGVIGSVGRIDVPVPPDHPISHVVVTPALLRHTDADAVGRGATLAQRCSMCHGLGAPNGATIPSLAGQPAAAVYKQLRDFRSGARASAVMVPLVADLSDADMRDLASYYGYLPAGRGDGVARAAPVVVADGAPMRGIAPCGSCHGGMASKAAAPRLDGQPAAYLQAQMLAFASERRRNDISDQMRNVARAMTAEEIAAAAAYYAERR